MFYLSSQAQGEAVPRSLEDLAQPHVDSFDYFLDEGMEHLIEHLEGVEVCSLENACSCFAHTTTTQQSTI